VKGIIQADGAGITASRGLKSAEPAPLLNSVVLKVHRRTGKPSYLTYPDFDADPHPALLRCVQLSLRTRQLECYDYGQSPNPPVLHRKEAFLHPGHPLHAKFARLTRQEEHHGLLTDPAAIGTRAGWEARLREAGWALSGHRLVRRQAPA
jgi:DNA phosphorothioation-associated putative methyltransferase